MSSLGEIYFNYNRAIKQARELDGVASKLRSAAHNDMDTVLNEVRNAWKSDSAPNYIRKGEKVRGDIEKTAKNLNNIAAAIRTIAERVRRAELEAWRIANTRNG